MTLREFLSNYDFDYKMEDGYIALIDNQEVNLGDIENERFRTVEDVIERLDNYINDEQTEVIDLKLIENGIYEDIVSGMTLKEKVEMADNIGVVVYDYYRAILDPSMITLEK